MYQFWANYRHPFRLFAFFSLFSLIALRTGELAYLLFLFFLLFLLPVPARWSEGRMAGFLPIVNEGGRRIVRWPRLALAWLCIVLASLTVSCVIAAFLDDWRDGIGIGAAIGVMSAMMVTVQGYTRAVEDLPTAEKL
jgi:hypothetical protein